MPNCAHSVLFESPAIAVKALLCRHPADIVGVDHQYEASGISLVRSGVFARVIGRASLLADSTQALFVNRGDIHRFVHPLQGGDSCTILEPSSATLEELLWHFDRTTTRFPIEQTDVPPTILHRHYALLQLLTRRSAGDQMAVEELSIGLCAVLVKHAFDRRQVRRPTGPDGVAARRRDIVEQVRLALNARLQCPPSLTELARTVQCSTFHLSRLFRAQAGMPIRSYVARLRATEAARWILDGATDLTSLALELGYYDHSHLTNAFRAVWGMPPSEFRRQRRGDAASRRASTSKRSSGRAK